MGTPSGHDTPLGESVALKSITGSAFSIGASAVTLVLGFARSVLLARLLLPEHFGVFALAMFFLSLAARAQTFGFNAALVHHDSHSREEVAAHFILRVGTALLICLITVAVSPLLSQLYPGQPLMPRVMLALAGLEVIKAVNSTPIVLLSKQLEFRRIAVLDVASSAAALVVATLMAWRGAGVWSLVGEQASGAMVRFVGLWAYSRPWSPRLKTSWSVIKSYFQFGWFMFLSSNLNLLLDRFDDFWTGTALGSTALGFYSKAYEFAHYPRRVVANPMISVFFPAFAKLQHDRLRLSRAYFRVCSLVVRVGFLFAGVFALVTPEFIHLLLGDKWLPMAFTFQLMLVYTLLDPLLVISSKLTTALGEPQALTKVKLVQMFFFVPAVVMLAHFFGINGVAVAADLMLALGIVSILPRVRRYVDFSMWKMLGYPALGLALALPTVLLVQTQLHDLHVIFALLFKVVVATVIYGTVLFVFEREQLFSAVRLVSSLLMRRTPAWVK